MFTYTNNAGYVFEKTRENMIVLLQSGAGQTLMGLKDRDDWIIQTLAGFTMITVRMVNKISGEVIDSATATLVQE